MGLEALPGGGQAKAKYPVRAIAAAQSADQRRLASSM